MLNDFECTYQRFVNTTPNPRATKKSKGELVGPPPPPPPLEGDGVDVDVLEGISVDADIVAATPSVVGVGVPVQSELQSIKKVLEVLLPLFKFLAPTVTACARYFSMMVPLQMETL